MIDDAGGTQTEDGPTTGSGPSTFAYELDADETPSEGVVVAVAALANREPTSLEPLYRSIDTDALDALFDRPVADPNLRTLDLTFEYEGYTVAVTGGDEIRISE